MAAKFIRHTDIYHKDTGYMGIRHREIWYIVLRHRSHGTWVYSTGNRAHPIGQGSYVTWGMTNGAGHSK